MKLLKATLTSVMILLIIVASESVLARGGHSGGGRSGGGHSAGSHSGGGHSIGNHSRGGHSAGNHSRGGHFSGHRFAGPPLRFGVIVGAPAFFYYPPPPLYYPPVVAIPSSTPVYIEQGDAQSASGQADGYWYYCAEAQAYYPYVTECPQGWQRVTPQPPGP